MEDCVHHLARGVVVSVEPAEGTIVYFSEEGFPNTALSSSQSIGLAAVLNLPPTTVTVRGHLESTGELVAETSARVRPDTVSTVELRPLRR